MYLAYIKYEQLNDKKLHPDTKFAIIGSDSESIIEAAKKFGSDPSFASGMYQLGSGWG